MIWRVYSVTHRESGRVYFGMSGLPRVELRWMQHQIAAARGDDHPFYDLLRSAGAEAFNWEVVEEHDNRLAACGHERQLMVKGGKLTLNHVVRRRTPKPVVEPWSPRVILPAYGPPTREQLRVQAICAMYAGGQRIMSRRLA